MSAATAKVVLERRTLRWSSPILFNDPFDVPREMIYGTQPSEVVTASARQIARLIEHPPENTTELSPKLRWIVETVKSGITPSLKAELIQNLRGDHHHIPTSASLDEFRQLWRQWLPDFRILCLTESALHSAMWLHYADAYKGVVLELHCDDELDSPWLLARPVKYSAEKPGVYTADGWAELLCLRGDFAVKKMLELATYAKSPDWSYESEWRLMSFKQPDDVGHFTDYEFKERELAGVYFGPLIADADRSVIQDFARPYARKRFFNVTLGMSRDFVVQEIDGTGRQAELGNL